jgi:alkenylglycerophosphocholine/alkenylglycerophosphoethanolamine hydrolase
MKNVLNLIYPILAIFYLISLPYVPYLGSPLVKALPILLLAGLVFVYSNSQKQLYLFAIGLVFSSMGDIVLALTFSLSFVTGLGLFLVAHLFYIASFWLSSRVSFKSRQMQIGIVALFAIIMAIQILPRTGSMTLPVGLYLTVIAIMAVTAAIQQKQDKIFFVGAMVFMLSDGLIAWNKFIDPIPESRLLIMTTYYIAQGLLTKGKLS